MEYVCLIIILIVTIVILKIGLNIRIKDLKKIKQMAYSEDNNKLTKGFPTNKQICREILEMLNNSEVTIEDTQDEKSNNNSQHRQNIYENSNDSTWVHTFSAKQSYAKI